MLKKTIRRLGALAMVLAMAVSVFAVNASAVDATEPVASPAVSKKITKSANTYVPNASFEFEITAAGEAETIGKNPGVEGVISIAKVDFAPSAGANGDIGKTEVFGTGGAITVVASKFANPGIYYYDVKEKVGTVAGVTYDPQTKKLAVYKYANGDIEYMFVKKNDAGKWVKDESPFTNAYVNVASLTISKAVKGTFADRNKEFTFTLVINGATAANRELKKGEGTITTDADGKFTLKDGESVIVTGLEAADTYKVVETPEDYTPSIDNAGVTVNDATAEGNMTTELTSGDKTVAYTNERNASTPTGVIMTIAPYALMVVLAGAFAVVFLTRRNRAE